MPETDEMTDFTPHLHDYFWDTILHECHKYFLLNRPPVSFINKMNWIYILLTVQALLKKVGMSKIFWKFRLKKLGSGFPERLYQRWDHCRRHFVTSNESTNPIFSLGNYLFYIIRVQHILSYHLIKESWLK